MKFLFVVLILLSGLMSSGCAAFWQPRNVAIVKFSDPNFPTKTKRRTRKVDPENIANGTIDIAGVPLYELQEIGDIAKITDATYATKNKSIEVCKGGTENLDELEVTGWAPLKNLWFSYDPGEEDFNAGNQFPRYAHEAYNQSDMESYAAKHFLKGLTYQVWKRAKPTSQGKTLILLSFRGTDFDSRPDWITNARWLQRLKGNKKDQYDQVSTLIPALIKEIKNQFPNSEVIVSGHSLGGGLAQKAGHILPELKKVYAFNSSPVTGHYDTVDEQETQSGSKGMTIMRIHEKGEILEFLRAIIQAAIGLDAQNPQKISVRYNFFTAPFPITSAIANHDMSQLACKLKCLEDQANGTDENCKLFDTPAYN